MKYSTRILTLLLAALSVAAFAQDTSSLKRTPKVGETAKFKLSAKFTMSVGEGTVEAMIAHKILKVGTDGSYVVEETTNGKVTFGGGEQPMQESIEKQSRSAVNTLLNVEGDAVDDSKKSGELRIDALQEFHAPAAPVKVGDTWTFEQKASSGTDNVSTKVDYKVEGAEEIDGHKVFKIHASGKETGGESSGELTFWIDRTDGSLVKGEGSLKKVNVGGAPEPLDMTFTLTRAG